MDDKLVKEKKNLLGLLDWSGYLSTGTVAPWVEDHLRWSQKFTNLRKLQPYVLQYN